MWQAQTQEIEVGSIVQYQLMDRDSRLLTYEDVIDLWQNSGAFCQFYTKLLGDSVFDAFFWEVRPVTRDRLSHDPFEFVLVKGNSLNHLRPNTESFKQYWKEHQPVVSFPNLGGDAQIVVPCPLNEDVNTYTHMARFVRGASLRQTTAFWAEVGRVLDENAGHLPKWLSTAGLGVFWLHVRIDSRPKYYRYRAYKQFI